MEFYYCSLHAVGTTLGGHSTCIGVSAVSGSAKEQ